MILVTGGTGFIGSYLLRQLVLNDEPVRVICRKTSNREHLKDIEKLVEWVEADLLDLPSLEVAMQGIGKVYHAGAIVSFDKRDHDRMMKVNVEGTANIVNLALDMGIKKFLHVSSTAALGRKEKVQHIDEQANWERSKYNSQYAISKFQAENEVWRGIAEGLNAVIINPSIVLGAGYWSSSSVRIFEQMYKGMPFYPAGTNGFVDVRDVANVASLLMESQISNERFIVNSENKSFEFVLSDIALNFGKKPPRIKITPLLAKIAYTFEAFRCGITGGKPVITRELANNSANKYYYNNRKIIEFTNYEFIPVDKTIKDSCEILLQSKKSGKEFGMLKNVKIQNKEL